MANNRLYIACPCGDSLFLGKYYPHHWEIGQWTDKFDKKVNAWLYKHRHAHKGDTLWGEANGRAPFTLVTESQVEPKPKQ